MSKSELYEKMKNDLIDESAAGAEADEQAEAQQATEMDRETLESLCREHICPECTVMQEAQQEKLRALADSENLKKRLTREMDEFRKYASESILSDLLPVLDNLDLALAHGGQNEACKNLVMGVEMTRKVFLDMLKTHGLTPVGEVGEEFDPNIHEAVGLANDPEQPKT